MARLHMPAKSQFTKNGGPAIVVEAYDFVTTESGRTYRIPRHRVRENPILAEMDNRMGEGFDPPLAVVQL